ncbi:MAG: SOS response-associated peptidase family protein, partial [Finegoldia magna]|nr:SOS response-associated peptidase family protein [Finegoldia magna]
AFFEWNQKNKDKYRLTVANQKIFSIAGIFREYKSRETSIRHVSMLTTEAKGSISEIHTRMPIILPKFFEQIYLYGGNSKEIHEFLLANFIDLDMENLSDSQLTFL